MLIKIIWWLQIKILYNISVKIQLFINKWITNGSFHNYFWWVKLSWTTTIILFCNKALVPNNKVRSLFDAAELSFALVTAWWLEGRRSCWARCNTLVREWWYSISVHTLRRKPSVSSTHTACLIAADLKRISYAIRCVWNVFLYGNYIITYISVLLAICMYTTQISLCDVVWITAKIRGQYLWHKSIGKWTLTTVVPRAITLGNLYSYNFWL